MREAYTPQSTPVPVRLRLADGSVLTGRLLVRSATSISETLNGTQPFVEFDTGAGERIYVAKGQVTSVMVIDIPPAKRLDASASENLAPYAILGIEPGAKPDAIRQAYLRITKRYHPDRFASVDLPAEVRQYLESMARRINAAYAVLQNDAEAA